METVEDKEEGVFLVSYIDLLECITCGETVEAAVMNALDANEAWIEATFEEGIPINQYCIYLLSRNDAVYMK